MGRNMTSANQAALRLLRRKQVEAETGYSRSTLYLRITQGLWPKPVRLGPRAVGWPAGEVTGLNAARIAGKTDADIRVLVARLEAARLGAAAAV
jgi:prophage regulatory protein